LAASGEAKMVISLNTSFKNRLIEKKGSKTIPKAPFDGSQIAFDRQDNFKNAPQNDTQTMVCAQNTVNNQVF